MAEASQPKKSLPKVNPIDQPYWQGAASGKLLLQKCRDCGKLQFFPRAVCVDCFSGNLDWIQASGEGKIHSFTWVRVPRSPAFREEVPICYINVILDEVKLGDRVKVAFQDTANPEIKLPVFELAQ